MRLFILLFALTGCGHDDSKPGTDAANSAPTFEPASDGANGKDGATGPQGPKGEKGDRGEKGETGPAGKNGKDGKDATAAPINQWIDELSGETWSILPSNEWEADLCGLYRFPSTVEMQDAIDHGILLAAKAIDADFTTGWTGDADSGGHVMVNAFGVAAADADTQKHGVFCVKD